MSDHFWLSDEQYRRLAPLLPTNTPGVPRVDDRRVISGIVRVLRSGCRWADAPSIHGPRKTLYNRFVRWAAKGIWTDIFHALAGAGGPHAEVLINSSAVKAHRCASGGKGGARAGHRPLACWAPRPRSILSGLPGSIPPRRGTHGCLRAHRENGAIQDDGTRPSTIYYQSTIK